MTKYPVISASGKEYEVVIRQSRSSIFHEYYDISLYEYRQVKNIFNKIKTKRIYLDGTLHDPTSVDTKTSVRLLVENHEKRLANKKKAQDRLKAFDEWDGIIQ